MATISPILSLRNFTDSNVGEAIQFLVLMDDPHRVARARIAGVSAGSVCLTYQLRQPSR
jgi:hypothetical protein